MLQDSLEIFFVFSQSPPGRDSLFHSKKDMVLALEVDVIRAFSFPMFFALVLGLAACSPHSFNSSENLDGSAGILNGELKTNRDTPASRSVVLIELLNRFDQSLTFCSAALIGPHTLMTAGHCFDPRVAGPVTKFRVLFESHYSSWGNHLMLNGTAFKQHPLYNSTRLYDHDVAIGLFSGNIPPGFAPVAIDTDTTANYSNETVYAYGYGRTKDYTGIPGEDLRDSTGTLYRGALRITSYNDLADRYWTSPNTRAHLCQGDSGGPQFLEKNGTLKIVGVNSASWGEMLPNGVRSCAGKSQATKVAPASGWIRSTEKELLQTAHYH